MGVEIERKFLVTSRDWQAGAKGQRIVQGYLCRVPERTVRVRRADEKAVITIKGKSEKSSRSEFEYEIPPKDADELLAICERPLVEKTRYRVKHKGHVWEVDVFHAANEGLIVAEIELDEEDEAFERPSWLGKEVSDDPRYYNANLVEHPFSEWKT